MFNPPKTYLWIYVSSVESKCALSPSDQWGRTPLRVASEHGETQLAAYLSNQKFPIWYIHPQLYIPFLWFFNPSWYMYFCCMLCMVKLDWGLRTEGKLWRLIRVRRKPDTTPLLTGVPHLCPSLSLSLWIYIRVCVCLFLFLHVYIDIVNIPRIVWII